MRENLAPIAVASLLVGGLLYFVSPAEHVSLPHAGLAEGSSAAAPQERKGAAVATEQREPSPAQQHVRSHATADSAAAGQAARVQREAFPYERTPGSAALALPTVAQAPALPSQQPLAASTAAGGDPQAGRLVYRKCQACHSLEPGKNMIGPSLAGIIGKRAGEVLNFNYSAALKGSGIVWDLAALDAYVLDPQKAVPGNKMPFPGLKTENERKDVIAYLASIAAGPQAGTQVAQAPRAAAPPAAATPAAPAPPPDQRSVTYIPDVRYTLRSGIAEGRIV